VIRDTAGSLLEALAGDRSLLSVLHAIQRRMRSGCHLNQRKNHPNAAQLLQRGSTNWALSPSVGAYGVALFSPPLVIEILENELSDLHWYPESLWAGMFSGKRGEAFSMSRISTKKSLIVGAALVAAMICTGIVAASAHTVPSNKNTTVPPVRQGIPAIPPARDNALISVPAVVHYLDGQGIIGSSPHNNRASVNIQNVQLTDVGTLNKLAHIFIPGMPSNEKVYYTQLKGPFVVSPNVSRPVLNTLLPSASNLPVLHTLLPNMRRTPGLNNLLNTIPLLGNSSNGVQPVPNTTTGANQPASGSSSKDKQTISGKSSKGSKASAGKPASGTPPSLGKLSTTHSSGLGTVLQHVYQVFDARTGNLLAWG